MERVTSEDVGVFVLTTETGSEYMLKRNHKTGSQLYKNGSLISPAVMLIDCSVGHKGRFGVFLDENAPDVYSILETTPITSITTK